MRTLYTFHARDYVNCLYALPEDMLYIFWVLDKGLASEGSGVHQVKAKQCQEELYNLENSGRYLVESIQHV